MHHFSFPDKLAVGYLYPTATDEGQEPTPAERGTMMTWAQRLEWVFGIVVENVRDQADQVKTHGFVYKAAITSSTEACSLLKNLCNPSWLL